MVDRSRSFQTTVEVGPKQRVALRLPFDPDEAWGPKSTHRVGGTVNSTPVRSIVERIGETPVIVVGPIWLRDCGIAPGDVVDVVLAPEGPQRADLAADVSAALDVVPAAGAFFDSLAQFYRRGYLRWIDATTRRPDLRAARIAEMVELLKSGCKERPRQ